MADLTQHIRLKYVMSSSKHIHTFITCCEVASVKCCYLYCNKSILLVCQQEVLT